MNYSDYILDFSKVNELTLVILMIIRMHLGLHTDAYLDINDINLATQCRKIIFDIITNLRNPLNISK